MSLKKVTSRTNFIQNAGILFSLPLFESFSNDLSAPSESHFAKRLFVMSNPLGMVPNAFHPKTSGKNYEIPELLTPFSDLKNDISLFSHLDHGLRGGHEMTHAFLSGVQQKEARSMPNGNITLDQHISNKWAGQTRYSHLCTKAGRSRTGGFSSPALSWTKESVNVPPIDQSRTLFKQLFIADSKEHLKFKQQSFKRHGSILDAIHRQAKHIETKLNQSDKQHFDQYLTSVRQIEKKLQLEESWLNSEKPQTTLKEPTGESLFHSLDDFFELLFWAFKTDLTRIATLEIPGDVSGSDFQLKQGYHTYSHHGQSDENLSGIKVYELFQMTALAKFIRKLKAEPDPSTQSNMLDSTLVLFGSGLGNASAHTNTNLPVLLSGGKFKHGSHHMFDETQKTPLSNLWLSLLHKCGINEPNFGRSTGTLRGFEV